LHIHSKGIYTYDMGIHVNIQNEKLWIHSHIHTHTHTYSNLPLIAGYVTIQNRVDSNKMA